MQLKDCYWNLPSPHPVRGINHVEKACQRDFLLQVFSRIIFPWPLASFLRPVQIFFKNLRRYWQPKVCTASKYTAGIVGTVGSFTAGINDTSGHTFPEIYSDCNDTVGKFATGVREFEKNRKDTSRISRWPEMIREKTWSQKSRDTVPLISKLNPILFTVLHNPKCYPSWSFMVFHGPAWSVMVLHGPSWSFMALHGPSWPFMVLHGPPWSFMVLHGPSWSFMVHHGNSWSFMVIHGPSWSFMVLHGPS